MGQLGRQLPAHQFVSSLKPAPAEGHQRALRAQQLLLARRSPVQVQGGQQHPQGKGNAGQSVHQAQPPLVVGAARLKDGQADEDQIHQVASPFEHLDPAHPPGFRWGGWRHFAGLLGIVTFRAPQQAAQALAEPLLGACLQRPGPLQQRCLLVGDGGLEALLFRTDRERLVQGTHQDAGG